MKTPSARSDAEEKFLNAAYSGKDFDLLRVSSTPSGDSPSRIEDEDRQVRGEFLSEVFVAQATGRKLHRKGVFLRGVHITGSFDLAAATVDVPIVFADCQFDEPIGLLNAKLEALGIFGGAIRGIDGDGLNVRRNLALADGLLSKGSVLLRRAEIGGWLNCKGATFESPGGEAISADGILVHGGVFFGRGFAARGEIRMLGARIGGQLTCNEGVFENPGGDTFSADRLCVDGSLHMGGGFTSKGEVRLLGAKIVGQFNCNGGRFENAGRVALSADGISVGGGIFMSERFVARGEVRVIRAAIKNQLNCEGGIFENPNADAINLDGTSIDGSVHLGNGFRARGDVRLLGAKIKGQLSCIGGVFENPEGYALSANDVSVERGVLLASVVFKGKVDLSHSSLGEIVDDPASWPAKDKLILDGFKCGAFAGEAPVDAASRIDWLRRQRMRLGEFWPQPYEEVIKILRHMGHERDAKEVAIAKQEDLRRFGRLAWYTKSWSWILGHLIGHGYKPWKALIWIGVCVVIGWCAFQRANELGGMRPSKERIYVDPCFSAANGDCNAKGWTPVLSFRGRALGHYLPADYPKFNAFWYSLDVFLPIVDLHQESYWQPTAWNDGGASYRAFMWVFIILGWGLTTIFVVGLTGIVKKD
ncbi:MAG: hypothetical protein AB7V46_24280 [Thermomicrobiales bacterium]